MGPNERRHDRVLQALDQRMQSVVVVLEAVRRRHNVSAILRTAEAMGLFEVHLVTGGFKASKGAARGAERWLDIRLHDHVGPCIRELQERGFRVLAAHPRDDAQALEAVAVDRPLALLLGAELTGVSEEALALVDGTVVVPMHGLTESLNVSVAAGILIHALAERTRARVGADLDPARRTAFHQEWLSAEEEARRARRRRARRGPVLDEP